MAVYAHSGAGEQGGEIIGGAKEAERVGVEKCFYDLYYSSIMFEKCLCRDESIDKSQHAFSTLTDIAIDNFF